MKPGNEWGKALEWLRLHRRPEEIGITSKKVLASGEISYRQMAMQDIVGQTEYMRWITGPQGPTIFSLGRWLKRMGYTWHDWANALKSVGVTSDFQPVQKEKERQERQSKLPPRDGPSKKTVREKYA